MKTIHFTNVPEEFLKGFFLRELGEAEFEAPGEKVSLFAVEYVPTETYSLKGLIEELGARRRLHPSWRDGRKVGRVKRALIYGLTMETNAVVNTVVEALAESLEEGIDFLFSKASGKAKAFMELCSGARKEFNRLKGFIKFRAIENKTEKFLVGYAETPYNMYDLLVLFFKERYPAFTIVLYNGRDLYVSEKEGRFYALEAVKLAVTETEDAVDRLWNEYFASQVIEARHNERLLAQRMPKRYWSWVKEGRNW